MWEKCFWKAGEGHKDFFFRTIFGCPTICRLTLLIQHPTEVAEQVAWFFRIFFLSLSGLMGL